MIHPWSNKLVTGVKVKAKENSKLNERPGYSVKTSLLCKNLFFFNTFFLFTSGEAYTTNTNWTPSSGQVKGWWKIHTSISCSRASAVKKSWHSLYISSLSQWHHCTVFLLSFIAAPTLDVDWQNNTSFASCSTDKIIHVCRIGVEKPVKSFQGHTVSYQHLLWLQIYFTLEVYCVCVCPPVWCERCEVDQDEFANKMKLVPLVLSWKWGFSVTSISYSLTPAKNIRRSLNKEIYDHTGV